MAKKIDFIDWIIQEDENYIFINKPAGIASLKERGNTNAPDILSIARGYNENVTLCHRIDKYTSGVMLIAKNEVAMRNGSIQFEKKKVHKLYHAIAMGSTEYVNHIVDLPILVDENRRTVRINKNFGKKSKTSFTTLTSYSQYSLIECTLFSGRMHQIRIHLSSIKNPIVGDVLYGGNEIFLSELKHKYNYNRTGEEQPIMKRFALHAYELGLDNVNGEKLLVKAPYPKDFKVLKTLLDRHCKR